MSRPTLALLAALLIGASLPAGAAPPAAQATYLVGFEGPFPSEAVALRGGTVESVDERLSFALVRGAGLEAALHGVGGITYVERNGRVSASGVSAAAAAWDASRWDASRWDASRWDASRWDASRWDASRWDASRWDASRWDGATMDPAFGAQWSLGAMHVGAVWERTLALHARTICVVDSGIDYTHPDLAPNVKALPDGTYGRDFVHNDFDPMDDGGHGTHVAGIAAASLGDGTGIAGVSQAQVIAAKVLDATGVGEDAHLAAGIAWCADAGANIVLLALHSDTPSRAVKDAIKYVQKAGLLVVAASGNEGKTKVAFPASEHGVLAVGAADLDATVAAFSNTGGDLSLLAPGVDVISLIPGGGYAMASGTSQAAANAAGAAALLWAAFPELDAKDVRKLLEKGAKDDDLKGYAKGYGKGHLRLDRSLAER